MCKATYNNSFCMDSSCKHYWEDVCTLAISESMVDIFPDNNTNYRISSKSCPQFKEGISSWYRE